MNFHIVFSCPDFPAELGIRTSDIFVLEPAALPLIDNLVMLESIKKCWQQHELISCIPQEDHVYSVVRNQLMKGNDEAGWSHLLSTGIQQLAVTAVSRHTVMAVFSQC